MGWQYDVNDSRGEEEQKKAWQVQSQKNVLAKKTVNAFKIEKKPLTKEEQKAKWKADTTGLVAKTLGALTIAGKKKETESAAMSILDYSKGNACMTFGVAWEMGKSIIVIDTAKVGFCDIKT